MIEKMNKVCVVVTVSKKNEMLAGLRDLGVLHLAEKQSADRNLTERFSTLSKTAMSLKDYLPEKTDTKDELLSDEDFEKLYDDVLLAFETKSNMAQTISMDSAEIDRVAPWGDFSVSDVRFLKKAGYDLHFYKLGKNEFDEVKSHDDIRFVRLRDVDKMYAIAVFGTLPQDISASEFVLPEKSISELNEEISQSQKKTEECNETLRKASLYGKSFDNQMLKAQNAEMFSSASQSVGTDEDFVWIYGYMPEADVGAFKEKAKTDGWAWAIEDVDEDDDSVPTKMRYNKVTKLIEPLFDILGILPGYREQDVSLWFLLFFAVFVAMIIGDAGYGVLILIAAIALLAKTGKMTNTIFLIFVLSCSTIVWGAITGTWFGMESAMNVPFLKALVIPNFANYPEYFGVTATAQQNMIMKFSFSLGAIQMTLGSILAVRKKLSEKDLSFVADIGWAIAVVAMYLLSLYLVIGESIPIKPVFIAVGCAFVLVVLFGGMSPDKSFSAGLKSGLADAFTVFLNTISCFGNVMSYIRLFAVGMASLAIAQSFNDIAAGFKGPLIIVAIIVVLIGHGLNIIMAFLSVIVHGVRLNVLEFSGQVGLEWAGVAYEPFRKNDKVKN